MEFCWIVSVCNGYWDILLKNRMYINILASMQLLRLLFISLLLRLCRFGADPSLAICASPAVARRSAALDLPAGLRWRSRILGRMGLPRRRVSGPDDGRPGVMRPGQALLLRCLIGLRMTFMRMASASPVQITISI